MNLSSIASGILAKFACLDVNAMNRYEIDSKKELEALGEFLNGTQRNFSEDYSVSDLGNEDLNVLKQIYNSLKEKVATVDTSLANGDSSKLWYPHSKEEYLSALGRINKDNIFNLDGQMFETIFNNSLLTEKEKKDVLKQLVKILIDKAKDMNLSSEEINNFKNNIKECKTAEDLVYYTKSFCFHLRDARKEYEIEKELEKIKNNTTNPSCDDRSELQKYAEEFWLENKGKFKKSPSCFGIGCNHADGDLFRNRKDNNYSTKQETGNCWAMGGINSMGVHEKSREYLNSHIYKDSIHGIYVVQLPEAKNKGLGKDGKGIYFITEEELYKMANIANGDLDIAAYNLAIKKYFEETGEHPDKEDPLNGNTVQRFYEISRGMEAQEISDGNIPEGVGFYRAYTEENKRFIKKSEEELGQLYDSLIAHFQNGGEITLGAYVNIEGHGLHALSVVGVKDGKFIIQESNNSEAFAKQFEGSWLDENKTWNILIDKKQFIEMINSVATNKL